MRLIYILLLLFVVDGSYSKKDCKEVLKYLNQGFKTNEILNMLSEDGLFLIDKISSNSDNANIQTGSVVGRLLYKKYMKSFVEECHLFYWKVQQKKVKAEEAKQKMVEAEENEKRAVLIQKKANQQTFWNIVYFVVIILVLLGVYCWIRDEFSKRYILERRKKTK